MGGRGGPRSFAGRGGGLSGGGRFGGSFADRKYDFGVFLHNLIFPFYLHQYLLSPLGTTHKL